MKSYRVQRDKGGLNSHDKAVSSDGCCEGIQTKKVMQSQQKCKQNQLKQTADYKPLQGSGRKARSKQKNGRKTWLQKTPAEVWQVRRPKETWRSLEKSLPGRPGIIILAASSSPGNPGNSNQNSHKKKHSHLGSCTCHSVDYQTLRWDEIPFQQCVTFLPTQLFGTFFLPGEMGPRTASLLGHRSCIVVESWLRWGNGQESSWSNLESSWSDPGSGKI